MHICNATELSDPPHSVCRHERRQPDVRQARRTTMGGKTKTKWFRPTFLLVRATFLVGLSGYFSNLHGQMKDVVRRLLQTGSRAERGSGRAEIVDSRGPVVRNPQKVQTLLSSAKLDEALARYAAGEAVRTLAVEYRVHPSTLWRHAAIAFRRSSEISAHRPRNCRRCREMHGAHQSEQQRPRRSLPQEHHSSRLRQCRSSARRDRATRFIPHPARRHTTAARSTPIYERYCGS